MLTSELDYDLPAERIATAPASPRDSAKLMVVHRQEDRIEHRRVRDLPEYFGPNDLMVFNQSKVIPAYFEGTRRGTNGRVTGLYLQSSQMSQWLVMLESRGKLQAGEWIDLTAQDSLQLTESIGRGEWLVEHIGPTETLELLSQIGQPPLPPYIRKARKALGHAEFEANDRERYNTVYAADPGSVAAPTAGLHFTDQLLAAIDERGAQRTHVTLHVGLGTFAPVREEKLDDHNIHSEHLAVPGTTLNAISKVRKRGGRIVPVGTTTVRTLESLPDPLPDKDVAMDTSLFVKPGFRFRFTDGLMTNFHLPQSTLLAMVAALQDVGIERLKGWYRIAVENEYRFYSYGDAMLIL